MFRRAIDALSEAGAPVKNLADAYLAYADLLEADGRTVEALAATRTAANLTASSPTRAPATDA